MRRRSRSLDWSPLTVRTFHRLCSAAPWWPVLNRQPASPPAGQESLRRCFEYFEELDLDYHNKFFRRLSISDNEVKSKEELPYEDRLHLLLHTWMEKKGRGASLDQLLQVLLDLRQRRTADNIRDKAVEHGHYRCEG